MSNGELMKIAAIGKPMTGSGSFNENSSDKKNCASGSVVQSDGESDAVGVGVEQYQRLHHTWDGDGEYCERCGDKDWFAGPECKSEAKVIACRPEDRTFLSSKNGRHLLDIAKNELVSSLLGDELIKTS